MDKKIFICDDDSNIVDMLAMVLREFTDATVLTETDSRKVLSRLVEECPDIFIVDLSMPLLSGDLLIKEVRKNVLLNKILIICMSAKLDAKEIAIEAGADIYLPKPFDINDIISAVSGNPSND